MSANKSGRAAEDVIASMLRSRGCEFARQAEVGTSIFGYSLRADFLVHNVIEYPQGLVIESKWQDRDGSVDEKLPYLVWNIQHGAYRAPVIVLINGGGCRDGAYTWLCRQVDGRRFVAVLNFEGLLSWLNRHAHVHVTSPKLPLTTPFNPG